MLEDSSNRPGYGGQPMPPGGGYRKVPVFTLVAWAGILVATVFLFFAKQHVAAKEGSMQMTQAEFLDRLASNQIVQATVAVNQQFMPLVQISGTYQATDKNGNAASDAVPFTVHNFMLTGEAEDVLTHSKAVSFSTENAVVSNLIWSLAPFLILGLLFWFFFMRQLKKK
jgi:ATP-dependent Zn protease